MKEYIITIIGATLLSAMAGIIAPEKWRSYVQVITGLVIISCIISPVTAIVKSDIFDGFDSVQENIADSSNMQTELVIEEFKLSVTAECEIMVNDEGEITGVDSVRVYGDKLTDRARSRICEVYGLKPYEVHDE